MSITANKRVFILFAQICLYFIGTTNLPANPQDDYQQSVEKIAKQINRVSRNLNANRALLKSEQDQLSDTEQKILNLRRQMAATNKNILNHQQAYSDIEGQISQLDTEQESSKQALANLVRERFIRGKPNYFKMLLNQQNPYQVGRLSHYYDYFSKAQKRKIQAVRQQIGMSRKLQQDRRQAQAALEHQQQRYAEQQQELEAAKKKRLQRVAKLSSKVARSNDQLKQLQQDRNRLNTLLEQIAEQALNLKRLEQEQEVMKTPGGEMSKRKKNIIRPHVQGGFLKQRGRLLFPVQGVQKSSYGSRITESGMRSQGALFETNGAVPVKTIFRGRVLFANYLKGYGLLLIVDHGDDHISLYGHNEVIYKKVGDSVETNEIVARTGISGGLKTPGLYFEIRQHATPVDPAKWCR